MTWSAARLAWYRVRATLRRRLAGYLGLAVVVGLIGGVALASVTAARRTDSAYPDYLASTNPSDLIIQPNTNVQGGTAAQANQAYQEGLDRIRHLSHVRGLATADSINAALLTPRGGYGPVLFTQVQLVASSDGMFTRQDRLTIIAGRKAVRPDEVVATTWSGCTARWPAMTVSRSWRVNMPSRLVTSCTWVNSTGPYPPPGVSIVALTASAVARPRTCGRCRSRLSRSR